MLAMLAAVEAKWSLMFLWLVVAFAVDGIDGPLARKYDVKKNAAEFDGVLLDLIIDYLTYVFIPAFALFKSGLMAGWTGWFAIIVITFASALYRLAEPFERLRDASDAALAEGGARPCAFLAALGPLAEHTGRTTWIRNLLAAGGIETRGGEGEGLAPEALAPEGLAAALGGLKLAVVTGSDARYDEQAAAAIAALLAAGAERVLVAGRPGEREEALRAAGASGFLYLGQDVCAELNELSTLLLEAAK